MLLWQLVLIQVVTFLALIFFLRMLFHRHLNSALKRLQRLQQENLEREEALKEELDKAKEEHRLEVASGKEEAKRLVGVAKAEAQRLRGDLTDQAKKEAKRIIEETEAKTVKMEQEFRSRMQDEAVHLSEEMIKYTFTDEGREKLQQQLLDEVIEELRKVDKERLKVGAGQGLVISAFPLTPQQQKSLKVVLEEKVGHPVELGEKRDPEIISGMLIKLGDLEIDGSLRNKLRKVIPYLREAGGG